MTEINQVADDLRFVRQAVIKQESSNRPPAIISWYWAIYVLIGYTLLDIRPQAASWFFILALILGMALTWWLFRSGFRAMGIDNRTEGNRHLLAHFSIIALILLSAIGLSLANPAFHGIACGQVIVVMFGLLYFISGAYGPPEARYLLVGGPIIIVGGICMSLIPHHGWTSLGVVIALIILLPLLRRRLAPSPNHG